MELSSEHSTEQVTSGKVWSDAGPNFMLFNPSEKKALGNRCEKKLCSNPFCSMEEKRKMSASSHYLQDIQCFKDKYEPQKIKDEAIFYENMFSVSVKQLIN